MPALQFNFVSGTNGISAAVEPSKEGLLSVDSRLNGVTSKILLTELEFKEASKTPKMQLDKLKSRYTTFNSQKPPVLSSPKGDGQGEVAVAEDGIPLPKTVLFDPCRLDMGPMKLSHVGPGLNNQGNTCFLNAVLQCLTYCAPLFNYLATDDHTVHCRVVGFCPLCELKRHMKRIIDHRGYNGPISPQAILHKLKVIAKHMCWGRQEDAHEFLRFIIDAMQKACLQGKKHLDKYSKETTLINQVFGGYLRSQVICLGCRHTSSIYETFMDLSLDIKNASSVEQALSQFVSFESLEGDNAYHCSKCRSKQSAKKHFTVHRCPNVLTLHLKRFGYSGNKMHKPVNFRECLDLRPYMSNRQGTPVKYRLFGVTCHEGYSSSCGHYTAYIRTRDNRWHHFNDCRISHASVQHVLSCQAYILFYVKETAESTKASNHSMQSPMHNSTLKTPTKSSSSVTNGFSKLDLGTPVKREHLGDNRASKLVNGSKHTSQSLPKVIPVPPKQQPSKQYQPLADNRSKISFGLSMKKTTPGNEKVSSEQVSTKGQDGEKLSKLVPYGDESSDSERENGKSEGTIHQGSSVHKSSVETKAARLGIVHKKSDTANVHLKTPTATDVVPGSSVPLSKIVHKEPICVTPLRNLTLVTSPAKVNSTTPKWKVHNHDALVSPSIASETSNASASSTSQWHVEDTRIKPKVPILPESQHVGWTVQEEGKRGVDASKTTVKENTHTTLTNGHKSCSKSPEVEDYLVDVSDKEPLLNCSSDKSKHKKHKKRKHKERDSDDEYSAGKKQKVMEKDWVSRDSGRGKDRVGSHRDGHREEKNRSDRFSHGRSSGDKRHRVKYDSDECSGGESRKHKHRDHERTQEKHSSSKRRHDDERRESHHHGDDRKKHAKYSDDGDDDAHYRSSKERKSSGSKEHNGHGDYSGNSGYHRKRSEKHGMGEDGTVEWVEVTKKTSQAESKYWDSHIKDGYKRPRPEVPDGKKALWDGKKMSEVAAQLEKMSSSRGYGDNVKSWNGESSHVNQDVEQDRSRAERRDSDDEYDADFDRGKTKKHKTPKEARPRSEGGNHFQSYQDDRNWTKTQMKNTYSTSIHQHSHHSHHDRGRNHGDRNHGHYRSHSGNHRHQSYDHKRHN